MQSLRALASSNKSGQLEALPFVATHRRGPQVFLGPNITDLEGASKVEIADLDCDVGRRPGDALGRQTLWVFWRAWGRMVSPFLGS